MLSAVCTTQILAAGAGGVSDAGGGDRGILIISSFYFGAEAGDSWHTLSNDTIAPQISWLSLTKSPLTQNNFNASQTEVLSRKTNKTT